MAYAKGIAGETVQAGCSTGLAILYGDMFKDLNITVHYSEVDNDDTIAAFAERDNAVVLSGDKDYYRYANCKFGIYSDFEIIKGRL